MTRGTLLLVGLLMRGVLLLIAYSRPSPARLAFGDGDAADAVAACDEVDDFEALRDAAEDGVAAVEVRLRRVRDEPLRAARVLDRERHPDRAALVRDGVDLAAYLVAGAAVAVAARVAALDDEVRDDAVERDVVEVVAARELHEVVHGERRL